MKKQKQKFDTEYGIYKCVYKDLYNCKYVLVKRGFYDFSNARGKANALFKLNGELHRVLMIKSHGASFCEHYNGTISVYMGA